MKKLFYFFLVGGLFSALGAQRTLTFDPTTSRLQAPANLTVNSTLTLTSGGNLILQTGARFTVANITLNVANTTNANVLAYNATSGNLELTPSPGASNATWGGITGTLANQTDLQSALDALAPINSPTFTGNSSGLYLSDMGGLLAANKIAPGSNSSIYITNSTGVTGFGRGLSGNAFIFTDANGEPLSVVGGGLQSVVIWNGSGPDFIAGSSGGILSENAGVLSFGTTLPGSYTFSGATLTFSGNTSGLKLPDFSGTLLVAHGGTNLTSITSNTIIVGNGIGTPLLVAPANTTVFVRQANGIYTGATLGANMSLSGGVLDSTGGSGGNLSANNITAGTLLATVLGTNGTILGNDTAHLATYDDVINYTPPITSNSGNYVVFGSTPLTVQDGSGSGNASFSIYGSVAADSNTTLHKLSRTTSDILDVLIIQKNGVDGSSNPVGSSAIDFMTSANITDNGTWYKHSSIVGALGVDNSDPSGTWPSNGYMFLSFSPPFQSPSFAVPGDGMGRFELQQEGLVSGNHNAYRAWRALAFNPDMSMSRQWPDGSTQMSLSGPSSGGSMIFQLTNTNPYQLWGSSGEASDELSIISSGGDNLNIGVTNNHTFHIYATPHIGFVNAYGSAGLYLIAGNTSSGALSIVTGGDQLTNVHARFFEDGHFALGANTTLASSPSTLFLVSGTSNFTGNVTFGATELLTGGNLTSNTGNININSGNVNFNGTVIGSGNIRSLGAFNGTQAVTNTTVVGLLLATNATATTGAQKFSSAIELDGQGFASGNSSSQLVSFYIKNTPVQGSANPTGLIVFSSNIAGGGETTDATLSNLGVLTLSGSGNFVTGSNSLNGSTLAIGNGNITVSGFGLGIMITGSNQGAFSKTQNIAITPTDGLVLGDTTASNGTATQHWSVRERLIGTAWNGTASQTANWSIDNRAGNVGSGNITSNLTFGYQLDSGSYSYLLAISEKGNVVLSNAGSTVLIPSGSNACAGNVTLSSGAATVSTTAFDANSTVILTLKTASGAITAAPYVSAAVAGTSFNVTAGVGDNSTYNWVIIKSN